MDRRTRNAVTFAVLTVSICSFTLLQSLIVPVLPELQEHYDTDQATVTWVLTGYLLSASIATPLIGRVGDVLGKTRVLTITLAALSVGSLLAALAPTIGWLIAARVLQGVGGGVMPLAFGIIRDEFRERMHTAISVLASLAAVGFGFGIVFAGPIVDAFGHRGLFWLPLVATLCAAIATVLFVPASPVHRVGRLPFWPAVLLAVWLSCLLLAVSKGGDWGWTGATVLGLFTAAAVGLAAWVAVERRVPVPMIDMQMMRVRGIWSANAVAGFMGFGMFGSFAFLPQLLQTPPEAGYGLDATIAESGQMLLPSAAASFLVGFVTAGLVRRCGARFVVAAGCLSVATSFSMITLWHAEAWQIYVATTAQGIGTGLVFAALAGVVVSSVSAAQTGVASGINANIRTIGGAIGAAVMAAILTARTGAGGLPVERGYTIGFTVLAAGMVVAAVAALAIPNLRAHETGGRLADADNAELGYLPGTPTDVGTAR